MQSIGNIRISLAKLVPATTGKRSLINHARFPAVSSFTTNRFASSAAQAIAKKDEYPADLILRMQNNQLEPLDNAPCLDIEWPIYHTPQQIEETRPLLQKMSNIPLVKSLVKQETVDRKEFFWPVKRLWMLQTPETMLFGALSGSNNLPLVPVIFQWRPGCKPAHLNNDIFESCISSTIKQGYSQLHVPGVTVVQYMGSKIGMSGVVNGVAGELPTVHPGVLTTIIDHFTARLGYSNMPQTPLFTANLQLEYLTPVPTDSFVVMDAWITSMEGRKTVASSYMADALTGQVFVKARALFVSAR